ncbi:MAG: hypothetical protein ACI4RB_00690, partial [Acutalibacteraceae bacterium]
MNCSLAEKISNNRYAAAFRSFLMSKAFVVIQFVIACVAVIIRYDGNNMPIVYGIIILGIIEALILVICDDIIATLPAFMLISVISIKCYDSFDTFMQFWYLLIPVAAALIFHFVVYRRKIVLGSLTVPYIIVSVAVTLGGVGIISPSDYFSGTSLYY